MSRWSDFRARLAALVHGDRMDRETNEELQHHLELETEKLLRSGLAPDDARRRARLALGGVDRTREEARDARGVRWLEDLVRDVRYGARQLIRTPGFTAVAVLTLALGIGANTAIYSVIDGVLLRRPPFAEPDRLVMVWETDRRSGTTREPASWPDLVDYARLTRTLEELGAVAGTEASFAPGQGSPTRLAGMGITENYFGVLGIRPLLGRHFTPAEARPGGPRVVQLGEAIWRSRFGADPDILGRSIRLNDADHTVVGVIPAGAELGLDQIHEQAVYHGTYLGPVGVDVWLPLQASEATAPRTSHPFLMIGRLGPGSTLESAQAELDGIAAQLARTHRENDGRGVYLEPLTRVVFGPVRPTLALLSAAVVLLLLVASVNVANLLLARGASRSREVALRSALGASRERLGRQLVVEALVLAGLGAALGVALAVGGSKLLIALAPADIPRIGEVAVDGRALALTLAVAVLAGFGFSLMPIRQAFRVDPIAALKGESRGSGGLDQSRVRRILVVAELALSVALVVLAGLVIRSFRAVLDVDPGFRAEQVVKAQYQLPPTRYPPDFTRWPNWTEVHGFTERTLDLARAIPGVEAVAIAAAHPLDPGFTNSFVVVGRESDAAGPDWPEISVRAVSPGYFQALGSRLVAGRLLAESDAGDAPPVAVINQAAVRTYFARQPPLGQRIRFWGSAREVVGVVGDERLRGPTEPAPPAVYVPLAQVPATTGVLLARGRGDPAALALELERTIRAVDPELAVHGVEPLAETLSSSVAQRRFAMVLMASFAGVTLGLALIGVHGVLSYLTAQRFREMGIRMALGATRGQVAALVVRSGIGLGLVGIVVGIFGAAAGTRLLTGLLFGIARLDPVAFLGAPLAILGVTLLAAWLPARRAARLAPVDSLRADG